MPNTAPASTATHRDPLSEPTPHQFTAAFVLWETRWRDDPAEFLTVEECAAYEIADISTQRAIYFCALLREVQGGAA